MPPTPSQQVMEMIASGYVAQSVCVAAELGIADLLAAGPKTSAELASAANADPQKLHRLLRFLASRGVFSLGDDGGWQLTPLAEVLRDDAPESMRAAARMMERMTAVLPHLRVNVRTGTCAYNLAFGKSIFEDLAGKPDEAVIFDAAMKSFHGGETDAVLDVYDYSGITTLADIGGGSGVVLEATLQRYPQMRGILFDQDHVIGRAQARLQGSNVMDRCTFVTGNFFETAPAGADAYTMRHIIHDWSDDLCVTILKQIRKVIPASGRVLIIEAIVPEGNEPSPSKMFDMFMMTLPDGLERTEAQFRELCAAAGFELTSITPTESPVSVIDARPV